MSHSIEQESDAHSQTIKFNDIESDGEQEILVTIRTIANGRRFETLEVIKRMSSGYVKLVTVRADRGTNVTVLDVNHDGRAELYGDHHGGQAEFWIWDDGQYVNIITERYWTDHGLEFLHSADQSLTVALYGLYQQWMYTHFTRYKD